MIIGYARVSTAEQSVDAQVEALRAAGCTEIFSDVASGKQDARPGLNGLMEFARKDDTVVITKLDRLGRSIAHLIDTGNELATRGVTLRVLDQGIDTSTAAGRMFYNILAAFAEFERELIAERTHAGLASARAQGRKGGRPNLLTETQVEQAVKMYAEMDDNGEYRHSIRTVAETFGCSRSTMFAYLGGRAGLRRARSAGDARRA